jgi:hypothetical protein
MSKNQTQDPLVLQLDELVKDLEIHASQNRANPEQGLYTEVLPRLFGIFKAIRSFFTEDDEDHFEGSPQEGSGSWIPLRYQTITTLEELLTDLFFRTNGQDQGIAGVFFLLLMDLYGYDEEQVAGHLQMLSDKRPPEPPPEPPAQEPTKAAPKKEASKKATKKAAKAKK